MAVCRHENRIRLELQNYKRLFSSILRRRLSGIAIELTNVCNLDCWFCWEQNPQKKTPRPKGYMSKENFEKIMLELEHDFPHREMGIALSYAGESLLHPNFDQCFETACRVGFKRISLFTNGVLLDWLKWKTIKETVREWNQPLWVQVTLHNSPFLPKVLDNLKNIEEVDAVTLGLNNDEMFTETEFQKLLDFGKTNNFNMTVAKGRVIDENVHYLDDTGSKTTKPFACHYPFHYMAILWNGDTLPCCNLLAPEQFSCGNVFETSVRQVWTGLRYAWLRAAFYDETPCETCELKGRM